MHRQHGSFIRSFDDADQGNPEGAQSALSFVVKKVSHSICLKPSVRRHVRSGARQSMPSSNIASCCRADRQLAQPQSTFQTNRPRSNRLGATGTRLDGSSRHQITLIW